MNQVLNLCGRGEIHNKVSNLIKKKNASNVTIICPWEMTIIYLRMLFIITIDAGRLSAIFAVMLMVLNIHSFVDGNGRIYHRS